MTEIRHPMKIVTQRTGLSSHVVRIWERRYGAVVPERSGTNRRLYSDEDIRRLSFLAKLTRAGHSIGQIANLPTGDLEGLSESMAEGNTTGETVITGEQLDDSWREAVKAIETIDGERLRSVIDKTMEKTGSTRTLEGLIAPLINEVGDRWEAGTLNAAQEHAASAVFKDALLAMGRPHSETAGAPDLIVTTPTGQLHELGAAIVACLARRRGWSVTYLGPSLPAEEIAAAARVRGSEAVALSIVYPGDDPGLPAELQRLRRLLPEEMPILVGGRQARAYEEALDSIGAVRLSDLRDLKNWFEESRR